MPPNKFTYSPKKHQTCKLTHVQCASIKQTYPGIVLPHAKTWTPYSLSNKYWAAQQTDREPVCFVTPTTAEQVAHSLRVIRDEKARFTVKGGGNTAIKDGSNRSWAVVIDLVNINGVTLSDDRQTVSVGAGNRWSTVYSALDPLGLAVVGSGAGNDGVGGTVLGGGISFLSGAHGWACDNVRNFEIVTLEGAIMNASRTNNKDLYWALRGSGGPTWGIVTKVDLATFEQGDLWTRTVKYDGRIANATLLPMVTKFAREGLGNDSNAHAFFVQSYNAASNMWYFTTNFFHASPPADKDTPRVFKQFEDLNSLHKSVVRGVFDSKTTMANVSAISQELNEPAGNRATSWVTSVAWTSPQMFIDISQMYAKWAYDIGKHTKKKLFTPSLVFQPVTQNMLEKMQQNGGNPLGLYPEAGGFMMIQVKAVWADWKYDRVIQKTAEKLVRKIEEKAEKEGHFRGFRYMNYAGASQEVFESYGEESYETLKSMARLMDPKGKGRKWWKGFFQVGNK